MQAGGWRWFESDRQWVGRWGCGYKGTPMQTPQSPKRGPVGWVWRSRDRDIMRIHHCSNEMLYHRHTHQQVVIHTQTHSYSAVISPVIPTQTLLHHQTSALIIADMSHELQQLVPIVKDNMLHFKWCKPSETVGTGFLLTLCSGVCLILWGKTGHNFFPVAISHRHCRAVKRPMCSKIKWGVERIGLICKAIGCREGHKIITLHRKAKCLLNHFKQYSTVWPALWTVPQTETISWGKQLNNQMTFNKLIIITLSKTFGRLSSYHHYHSDLGFKWQYSRAYFRFLYNFCVQNRQSNTELKVQSNVIDFSAVLWDMDTNTHTS